MTIDELDIKIDKIRATKDDYIVLHITDLGDQCTPAEIERFRQHFLAKLKKDELHGCLLWSFDDETTSSALSFSAKELKQLGRCPKCAKPGNWQAMAMVCADHGPFMGA